MTSIFDMSAVILQLLNFKYIIITIILDTLYDLVEYVGVVHSGLKIPCPFWDEIFIDKESQKDLLVTKLATIICLSRKILNSTKCYRVF